MKTVRALSTTVALFTASQPAFAAEGGGVTGSVFTWVFLGFCSLILVGQLIPALLMLWGMFKGVTSPSQAKHQAR